MINIIQEPHGLQAVNSDHIWTISDSEYTGYTNYKYVVDFYIDPYEEGWEKIGRIKLRPNSYGKGSFDARDIIKNYIQPNPRQQLSFSPNVEEVKMMLNDAGFQFTNALNNTNKFETLRHIANYRILIGKEYTSGGTTTIDIPTDYYTPSYSLVADAVPGTDNITWSNANGWEDLVSDYTLSSNTWNTGFTWSHITSGGGFVDGGSSLLDGYTYVPTLRPNVGDILWVYSLQNGCGYWFEYQYESANWDKRGSYSADYGYDGCSQDHSDFKTIWLGASPNLLSIQGVGITQPLNSMWADLYKIERSILGTRPFLIPYPNGYENQPWGINYGSFLNTYGTQFKKLNITGLNFDGEEQNEPYWFVRKHHRDCPIVVNWMNGKNGAYYSSADFLITFSGTGNNIVPAQQLAPSVSSPIFTPSNQLIQSYVVNDIPDNTDWQGFFLTDGTPGQDAWGDGSSMLLLYELYGDECMDDPVHFLFINRHGGFDTYTFGQKNIRSHSTNISTYAKNGITDTNEQRFSDYMYRNTPYDQQTITSVEAQSTFVDENDVPIIQDLFISPYVWRIQKIGLGAPTNYLVPIQITSNSVEEYKSRYNKLYQYDITFQYNPIRQFNNPL